MTDHTRPRRRVVPGRAAILGTAAAVALGSAAQAGSAGDETRDGYQVAQASQDGAAGGGAEATSGGEGEGASSGGEGESSGGEGEGATASGEGASSGGDGEGASSGGEGEGAGASAGGEGEGEGGGSALDPEVVLLRDLGFMTGHLRAGLALHEQGDVEAAKTHIGHPIQEKYEAVAGTLDARGHAGLRDQMTALIEAAESGADHSEIRRGFDAIIATVDEVRAGSSATPAMRLRALAELGGIAAKEYDIAIADDGSIENLHEYQDSWGFLRTIESQAGELAGSDDQAVAEAAQGLLEQVEVAGEAYGNLQGEEIPTADPSILYGAAARMELAALGAKG